jgi:hypothetical protein
MTFLNSGLLAVLIPLLALPLVIHLLNRRFPQRFLFPSVEHLRKTAAERSRIYRWRHRILTLVRTLFLLLLLFVFLKPVLDRYGNAARRIGGRQVLLVVDGSASMEFQRGGLTGRDRARLEAEKILGMLGGADEVNVVAVAHTPSVCFTGFSRDLAEARRFLRALPPGIGRADFGQANITAGRLLEAAPGQAEIYYLSDFQRKNWARVDFAPVEARARLFFVDLAAADAANHAILGAELPSGQVLAGDTVPLEVTIGNFGPTPLRETLSIRIDREVELQQAVEAGPWSSAKGLGAGARDGARHARLRGAVAGGRAGDRRPLAAHPPGDGEGGDRDALRRGRRRKGPGALPPRRVESVSRPGRFADAPARGVRPASTPPRSPPPASCSSPGPGRSTRRPPTC